MRVLLLEDDADLRTAIVSVMRPRGMAVDEVALCRDADERLRTTDYDVVILDRSLPDGDAATLLMGLRRDGWATPVLFLTAMADITDRVTGLDSGGDDYLVKPFAMEEFLARVRSLGRRSSQTFAPALELADLVIDEACVTATRGDRVLPLTPKEFAILAYLVRHAGRVISRSELLEHCWDEYADPTSNVIEVRMRLLRNKVGDPQLIHTVRGSGYVAATEARG